MTNDTITIRRGDVFYAQLNGEGCIQSGLRPVIVVSNEMNNTYAPTINVVPLTSKIRKKPLPVHVFIEASAETGLSRNSIALAEQIMIINKESLIDKKGHISNAIMQKVQNAIKIQLCIV